MKDHELERKSEQELEVELVDCGSVSEETQGMPVFFYREVGTEPYDKLFPL
jgi:hypothetical protein